MKNKSRVLLLSVSIFCSQLQAREIIGFPGRVGNASASGCAPATSKTDLNINNVRALIMNGGDMFWDQGAAVARYEVPKNSAKMSFFAHALWVGGIDAGGQLKTAAQTYRQTGNDFWPGPLNVSNATIDPAVCSEYDKHFQVYRQDVAEFVGWLANPADYPGYTIPQSINNYPGNGNVGRGEDINLAPFNDANGDGLYKPEDGDYPNYDIFNQSSLGGGCEDYLFGDQTLFWVFNDKGNIHSETGGQPIGLEVRAQGFAFVTNDEINNMTFYQYQVINRSNISLGSTYFGSWNDPDLGLYTDDFIGCDVHNGLGFCYNGDDQDGTGAAGTNSYGFNPPAVGVDFFKGPIADPYVVNGDTVDRPSSQTYNGTGFGDGIVGNERWGMENFMIFKNDGTVQGNPSQATHFYNYLQSKWKDGTNLTYGGTGYGGSVACRFGFPWTSDDSNNNVDWQCSEVADWRFIHSSGPFTLKPGSVNYVTTGVVWAKANSGGPKASVDLMRAADVKAQSLFDNCFQVLEGPKAPDLTIQEMNQELILYLTNPTSLTFNNRYERYFERDPLIVDLFDTSGVNLTNYDKTYDFEGYMIYQVKDETVTTNEADLNDPDKARLVFQCDKANEHGQLVNYTYDPSINASYPTLKNPTIDGYNKGIKHSFRVKQDAFSTSSDKKLVNHKTYYFLAIAYGANNYKTFNANDPNALDGQKKPYISGGKNSKGKAISAVAGIPHITAPEFGGVTVQTEYGASPRIKRIEGQGNGGFDVLLTQETIDAILSSPDHRVKEPVYENGRSPVGVMVIDPLNIPNGDFELKLLCNPDTATAINKARWSLTYNPGKADEKTVLSDTTIEVANEQLVFDFGLSVTVSQAIAPGVDQVNFQNGFISAEFDYADPTKFWMIGIPDGEGQTPFNWIRCGTTNSDPTTQPPIMQYDDYIGIDDNQYYEKIAEGTWAPYILSSNEYYGMSWANANFNSIAAKKDILKNTASVDIMITSDKTKWTRCPVIEMQDDKNLAVGQVRKFDLRKSNPVDKDGNVISGNDSMGMSWFPGYAINVETGERLNMAFGEDSWLEGENGRDMMWNPTSNFMDNFENVLFGGKHFIYVFGHNKSDAGSMPKYDGGKFIYSKLSLNNYTPADIDKRAVYRDAMWVGAAMKNFTVDLFATDLTVRLRVARPYQQGYAGNAFLTNTTKDTDQPRSDSPKNNDNPLYSFNTADIAPLKNQANVAKNALDIIRVVPNPYYAYSAYESNNLESIVKVTNLPQECTVSIYTVNGTLIRRFEKDDPKTSLDWDLKNQKNIPIGSGMYLVHVNVPNVGEKVLKFFATLRPLDLEQF